MALHNKTKINQMLQNWPQGTVATTHWFKQQNVSRQLRSHYLKSNWLETIGSGAFKRAGDSIDWKGGLYAIQQQEDLSIHAGGLTAIVLQGSGHYIRFKENIQLFGNNDSKSPLPAWFKNYKWEDEIHFYRTGFLPQGIALTDYKHKEFTITISSLERAILECLFLVPSKIDMVECYHIMEGLIGLRPDIVQQLLSECKSIKVKRLFLFLAEKTGHPWLKYINTDKINLGTGKRHLIEYGVYNSKYKITVPKELENI